MLCRGRASYRFNHLKRFATGLAEVLPRLDLRVNRRATFNPSLGRMGAQNYLPRPVDRRPPACLPSGWKRQVSAGDWCTATKTPCPSQGTPRKARVHGRCLVGAAHRRKSLLVREGPRAGPIADFKSLFDGFCMLFCEQH